MKTKILMATGYYPCPWDDFIDKNGKVMVSIYTLENAKKDSLFNKKCIFYDKKEKIYDIVINVPNLTEKIAKKWIEKLSKITKIKYKIKKAKVRYQSIDI